MQEHFNSHKTAANRRILSLTRVSCFSKLRRDANDALTELIMSNYNLLFFCFVLCVWKKFYTEKFPAVFLQIYVWLFVYPMVLRLKSVMTVNSSSLAMYFDCNFNFAGRRQLFRCDVYCLNAAELNGFI